MMEAFLEYWLKASGILAVFFLVYQLLLKKETFFAGNRHFLLSGILCALVVPFLYVTKYIETTSVDYSSITKVPITYAEMSTGFSVDWILIFVCLYTIGVAILFVKFILQLLSLRKLFGHYRVRKEHGFIYVETEQPVAPFSFFNHIVYNPSQYSPAELQAILTHEKAHSSQWHSVDILLSHLMTILLWPNPICWFYRRNIQQNLEFLADAFATRHTSSIKTYQLTLLKVSGIQYCNPITNNFYNSLIKKRIVMLHKSKSDKKNVFKYIMVLPLLTLFVFVFNVKTEAKTLPIAEQYTLGPALNLYGAEEVYVITKEMTDADIASLGEEIKANGAELTVKKVKRNDDGHITSLEITYKYSSGGKVQGTYSETEGIPPIHFGRRENGGLFMSGGNSDTHDEGPNVFHFDTDHDDENNHDGEYEVIVKKSHGKKGKNNVWVSSSDGKKKVIEIEEVDGKRKIMVNGKEVSNEEMKDENEIHSKHVVRIKKSKGSGEHNVMIIKDSDDDHDIEVIESEGNGFFFIDMDGDETPLFYIDGKEATEKEVKALSPKEIESINVFKGDKAIEKFGDKAKDGVVEVTTKKED